MIFDLIAPDSLLASLGRAMADSPHNNDIATVSGWLVLISFLIFYAGACFGSFANACALRLVRDEDFIHAKSRCRTCERPLGIKENIPLFGYIALRGRCSCRQISLSPRYLLVELFMGLITLSYAAIMPPVMAIGFSLAAIFIAISFLTDIEAMILHPALLTILGGLGLAFAIAGSGGSFVWHIGWSEAIVGALIGAGMPLLINAIFRLIRGKNGFGEGDFWLLSAIGAWLGPVLTIVVFFGAAALGAIAGIALILLGKAAIGSKLPFGLFLSVVFILCSKLYMLLN
ncbi:prepilin peptidase [Alphaproteobacteria bacterium]|nr:prepilin peptidase [Alphaproteobacteria bacterium]